MAEIFTLQVGQRRRDFELADEAEGEIWVPAPVVEALTGWKLDVRGLCREGSCVPRSLLGAGARDDAIELTALARAIGADLEVHLDGASGTLRQRGPSGR